jgi:hypothetical protein
MVHFVAIQAESEQAIKIISKFSGELLKGLL